MLNSDYKLCNKIVKYSMHNANSTLDENVRYFMYKYNLTLDVWNQNINNIYKKVDMYETIMLIVRLSALQLQLESCVTCVIQMIHRSLVVANSNS